MTSTKTLIKENNEKKASRIFHGKLVKKRMKENIEVLVIKGEKNDLTLIKTAFVKQKIIAKLHVLTSLEDAMDFLEKRGGYKSSPRPDLVIVDLDLPFMAGRRLLLEMKLDDTFKMIPAIILTGPENEKDIKLAYGNYERCYVGSLWNIEDDITKALNG